MSEQLEQMIAHGQLSPLDAETWRRQSGPAGASGGETEVLRWLASQYGLEYTDLEEPELDRQLLTLFPARVLLRQELLPLARVDGRVRVATARLFATEGLDMLRSLTGLELEPVLAPAEAIRREMKRRLGLGADTLDKLDEEAGLQVIDEARQDDVDLDEAAQDASIIRFVNQVLSDAIALRATDVHLEPFEDALRIRYRIDGVLQEIPVPAQVKRYQPAIVSRVKILSRLDIAEKRLPQDGRIKVRVDEHEVDIRVSLIPMLHGEGVVMRLLKQDGALAGLAQLGMAAREERIMRAMLAVPHGIVLVTGPTGSGKTTTLYCALTEINDEVRKIITIEDPIEYHMRGINQIQVNEKSGMTFARGLRSILRHDPDVVLIGEIRDAETAQIAVQAALTGHLVFSTLHTNDAPGALTRLVDMGVEPYLVASALEGVLAQRLVRKLCGSCRVTEQRPAALAAARQIGLNGETELQTALGCEDCRQTGFLGRRGVFEMMPMSDGIRGLMMQSRSTGEVRALAVRQGMRSLAEDGWRLVAEGVTNVDEVLRVTRDERVNHGEGGE